MDYPSKKYAVKQVSKKELGSYLGTSSGRASLRSKLPPVMAGLFMATWLYLSYLSDGLFMNEACLCGIIVCVLMMFKTTK